MQGSGGGGFLGQKIMSPHTKFCKVVLETF